MSCVIAAYVNQDVRGEKVTDDQHLEANHQHIISTRWWENPYRRNATEKPCMNDIQEYDPICVVGHSRLSRRGEKSIYDCDQFTAYVNPYLQKLIFLDCSAKQWGFLFSVNMSGQNYVAIPRI